jgi:hypothetical protein
MPVSQDIIDNNPTLGNKLNAIESNCIARDAAEEILKQQSITNGDPVPYTYIPCTPFFSTIISWSNAWYVRDKTDRKNTVAQMYVELKNIADLKKTFEDFMISYETKIPDAFYTTHEDLTNFTIGNAFDRVFSASGFWDIILSRPVSYYSNDNASNSVATDQSTYLDSDDQAEWQRSEDERTIIAQEIAKFTNNFIDESGITIQKLLDTEPEFATGYNKYK